MKIVNCVLGGRATSFPYDIGKTHSTKLLGTNTMETLLMLISLEFHKTITIKQGSAKAVQRPRADAHFPLELLNHWRWKQVPSYGPRL